MGELLAGLAYERRGQGPGMVLLHGVGHRRQVWTPLLADLAADHDVVAFDLPGCGESPPLGLPVTGSLDPTVDRLERALDELGWDRAHLVGNSLGGWLALELAKRGRAASVTALAPAGLWTAAGPDRRIDFWFRVWVGSARAAGPLTSLLRLAPVRTVALARLFGRPWRVPPAVAVADARNLAASDTLEMVASTRTARFTGGRDLDVPVTVAWCARDPLFSARRATLAELPDGTRVVRLRGCGHVPTWDNPPLVVETIRMTEASARAGAV